MSKKGALATIDKLCALIVANENEMKRLRKANEEPREKLLDLMQRAGISRRNITLEDGSEHGCSVVDKRGYLSVEDALYIILKRYIFKHARILRRVFDNNKVVKAHVKQIAKDVATDITKYFRIDAVLVSVVQASTLKGVERLLKNKTTKAYIRIVDGHISEKK